MNQHSLQPPLATQPEFPAAAKKSAQNWLRPALILWFLALLIGISFVTRAQESSPKPNQLSVQKADIEQLFQQKPGESLQFSFSNVKNMSFVSVTGKVLNHINPGSNSGAIRATVKVAGEPYKLLLTRKPLGNNLKYTMYLIPEKGQEGYSLDGGSGGTFFLNLVSKSKIVTP